MTGLSSSVETGVRVLIEETPASGAWNMAVDELLLNNAVEDGQCSLRWYRWEEPTLSLGYFQPQDDPLIEHRFAEVPRVRRLSGGGAILHDRELTYSCALGADHPLASQPTTLYAAMHAAIMAALSNFGISLTKRGRTNHDLNSNFLCFQRGDHQDVCCGHHKVLGSAQRRRRGAVLQHGSLLLERSAITPEFPGLSDLCGLPLEVEVLLTSLRETTAPVLGEQVHLDHLTDRERLLLSSKPSRS